jgi:hypothetical protein
MNSIACRLAAAGLAISASLCATPGSAAAIGTILGRPHILGTVASGEFEEVKTDLTGHFDQPLSLKIDPRSHSYEVMRIGLWLREQQPTLKVRGSCVGACAWFMLDSGHILSIDKGTVIAFSVLPEAWAQIRMQLDRGDLSIDDERSRASTDDFIARIPAPIWEHSQALRDARLKQAAAPAWIQQFVEGTTQPTLRDLVHDETDFKVGLQLSPQNCLWWVPDEEGLRQLGLSAPRYQPVTAAEAGKALDVDPKVIYVGPALREPPPKPLCEGAPNLRIKLPFIR